MKTDFTIGNERWHKLLSILFLFISAVAYAQPTIKQNKTQAYTTINTAVTVSVETGNSVAPAELVDNVTIEYGPADSADLRVKDPNLQNMTFNNSNGRWEYTVPANCVKELGIVYKVWAFTLSANSGQIPYSVGISYGEPGLTIPYSTPGKAVSNYQIIAVPLDLDNKMVNAVFGDELGNYGDKKKWRIFHYTGTSTQELTGTSLIQPGAGYWFITTSNATLHSGPGNSVGNYTNPFTVNLVAGWNQIGNPYTFNIRWIDIKNVSSVALNLTRLRIFSGSWQDAVILDKFQGGFVFTDAAGTLTFPAVKDVTVPGNGRISNNDAVGYKNAIDGGDWELALDLSDGKQQYNMGGFGMHPEASPLFDQWDDFTLPRFIDYLEVNHNKQMFDIPFAKDIVPPAENYTWTFDVESSANSSIEMKWDNSYFGNNSKELVLWDVKQQLAINMREQSAYRFNPSAGNSFKVFFGEKDYVKSLAVPDRMVFHFIYPNPSVDKFNFAFSTPNLPDSKWVTMEVIDLLGNKIATVTNDNYTSGYHEVNWEAIDNTGSPLPAGMYIARLKNSTAEISKKIILKK